MVGASDKETRPSHSVFAYLLARGYHVIGVNPGLACKSVHGAAFFETLAEVPGPILLRSMSRVSCSGHRTSRSRSATRITSHMSSPRLVIDFRGDIQDERVDGLGKWITSSSISTVSFAQKSTSSTSFPRSNALRAGVLGKVDLGQCRVAHKRPSITHIAMVLRA